jgi:hypothetical protein
MDEGAAAVTFSQRELEVLARMEERIISLIEKTDWSRKGPLTPDERLLVGMSISLSFGMWKRMLLIMFGDHGEL